MSVCVCVCVFLWLLSLFYSDYISGMEGEMFGFPRKRWSEKWQKSGNTAPEQQQSLPPPFSLPQNPKTAERSAL